MKIFGILSLLILILSLQLAYSQINWQQTNGPYGGSIYALAMNGSNTYAGTWGAGAFLSTNNGTSWASINSGLTNLNVSSLVTNGSNLYAGTANGVFLSTNNGTSWTQTSNGLTDLYVQSLAASGSNLYAGTGGGGLFNSTNNGATWTAMNNGLTSTSVTSIIVKGSSLFTATAGGGVFSSNDNGTGWIQRNNGLTDLHIISLATNGTYLYAGCGSGAVYMSANDGTIWTKVDNGSIIGNVYALAVNGSSIYAGASGGGVYVSTNNGSNWSSLYNGLTDPYIHSLLVNGSTIFAGTDNGGGVFLSANNGASWTEVNIGLIGTHVFSLVADGSNLYAGTDGIGGAYRSTNNGTSWTAIDLGVLKTIVFSLALNGSSLYAGTNYPGVFVSTNNGASWRAINNGLPSSAIFSIISNGSNLYAGTYANGAYISTNNGASWAAINNGLTNFTVNAILLNGSNLFAATDGGVFLSTNDGTSWTAMNNGLTNLYVRSLMVNGSNLFAGTSGGGVFLSTNNGASWRASGCAYKAVYSLACNGSTLYAGTTDGGAYVSTDNGGNWTTINNGLKNLWVQSFTFSGSMLYAGTYGSGVWKSELANVPPAITSISPSSGPIGTALTISGANFNTTAVNNIVYFGAVKAPVTAATSTLLSVTVPIGATYQPISVLDVTTGLTAYSSKPFIVTFGGGGLITNTSFAAKVDFTTGAMPRGVAICDVDGDGKPDLIVVNISGNTISVFRNTSASGSITASSFASKVDFTGGGGPNDVAISDIDGDGKPDLVITNPGYHTISIFRNTSTAGSITASSFAPRVDFAFSMGEPLNIAISDLDGDGKPDLVVPDFNGNSVSVFRNTSTSGSITASSFALKVDFTTGANPQGVAVSDIDGDGKPDFVVTNTASNTVSVFRNISASGSITTGSFEPKVDFTTGTYPVGVALNDMDGDGKPDLLVTNANSHTFSVFRNTGASGSITAGSFSSKVDFITGGGGVPEGIAIGDVDGDGKPDIVVCNWSAVSVFRNTSASGSITTSSFASMNDFTTGANPNNGLALGDLDGDGKPDLLIGSGDGTLVSVLQNTIGVGTNTPAAPQNLAATAGNGQVTLKWNKNTESDFLKYRIYMGSDSTAISLKDSSSNSILDTTKLISGLTNGTKYYFRVSALDSARLESGKSISVSATPAVLNTLREYNPDANTVLLLHMDEATGSSVSDASGNGNNGTPIGTTIVDGRFGKTRSFNGSGDHISINHSNSLNFGSGPFTAEIWIKLNAAPTVGAYIFNKSDGPGYYLELQRLLSNSNLGGNIYDGSNPSTTGYSNILDDGKWHHCAFIRDASFLKLYIDGLFYFKNNSSQVGSTDNVGSLFIGQNFPGIIDEFRLSNIARSPQEFNLQLPPMNLTATPNGTIVNLAWQNGGGAVPLLRYKIYRGADSTNVALVDSTASLSLQQSGLGSGLYYFRISAVDSTGFEGAKSYAVKAATSGVFSPPIITSFTPTSGSIGSTVTITGSNFNSTVADNIVYFGAVKAAVTAATSTSLSVSVPVGATFQPISVTVNGLSAYASAPFIVTFPGSQIIDASSFASRIDFATGTNPKSIAIGDLDGDGKPDFVIANMNSSTVSVFRNISTSGSVTSNSFAPKLNLTTESFPSSVAIGDIDGDGKPDIVVMCGNGFSVFKNNNTPGSITASNFVSSVNFTAGSAPEDVSIRDLDGDGKLDVIVANQNGNTISIFRNTYSGGSITANSFAPKVDFVTGTGPNSIAIGDLDDDGKPDLVVANGSSGNSNTISIFRNTSIPGSISANSFAPKVDFTTGFGPCKIAIGDLDGDGKADLIVPILNGKTVSIFKNQSTPGSITANSFAPSIDFTTGTGTAPTSVAISDLDGAGKPDLVTANFSSNTISVFRNISTMGSISANSFDSRIDLIVGSEPYSVAIGDLDCDGRPDLIVTNYIDNTVSILRNMIGNSNSAPAVPQHLIAIPGNGQVTLKWNKNTESDFLKYLNYMGSDSVTISLKDSSSNSILDTVKIVAGLINGTKYFFRVSAVNSTRLESGQSYAVSATPSASSPPVITSFTPTSGPIGTTVTISGANFIATAANNIVYFGGVRSAVLAATSTSLTVAVPLGATYQPIAAIVNGLLACSPTGFIVTFSSKQTIDTNSFARKVDFGTGTNPADIAVGDFDGDGKLDIAAANNNLAGVVSVFCKMSISSSGSFADKVDYVTGQYPSGVATGDIDGDGKLDIAVLNRLSSTVSVLLNTSTSNKSSFAPKLDYVTESNTNGIAIGDIDGDGKLDLVVTNTANTISLFRNTSTIGNISFASKAEYAAGNYPLHAVIGDVDGDGKCDIIVTNYNSNTITILRNTSTIGSISFAPKVDYLTGATPFGVAIGDIDGDGKLDVVVTNDGSNTVSVFRNTSTTGNISFDTKVDYATGINPRSVAISDIDGDGKLDLAVGNFNGNTISIYRNTSTVGNVSFMAMVNYGTGDSPGSMAIGDIDQDGRPDIAVTNLIGNSISVLRNTVKLINGAPDAPIDLTATAISDSQIDLHWSNSGGTGLYFRVFRSLDSLSYTKIDSTAGTSYSDTTLAKLTTYWYKLTAINDIGKESDFSLTVNATTLRSMPRVITLALSDSAQCGDVKIAFHIRVPAGAIAQLAAAYSTDSGKTFTSSANVAGGITNISVDKSDTLIWRTAIDLPNFESRAVKLRLTPSDQIGDGVPVTTNIFIVDNKPPAFTGLTAAIWDTNKVRLRWQSGSDLSPIVYSVYRSSASGAQNFAVPEAVVKDTNAVIPNLPALEKEYFIVRASDALGNKESNTIERSLRIAPPSDFTGDMKIDGQDLAIFAWAWINKVLSVADIGPAKGSAPNFNSQPDGKIDLEDLMIFAQMWDWSLDQPSGSLSKLAQSGKLDEKFNQVETITIQPRSSVAVSLSLPEMSSAQTMEYSVRANGQKVQIDSIYSLSMDKSTELKNVNSAIGTGVVLITNLQNSVESIETKEYKVSLTARGRLYKDTVRIVITGFDNNAKFKYQLTKVIVFNPVQLLPESYALHQNYPNPFNPSTTIEYDLPDPAKVTLKIFNMLGQEVATFVDGEVSAGYQKTTWNANVSSGVYFYRLEAVSLSDPGRKFVDVKKMILMR